MQWLTREWRAVRAAAKTFGLALRRLRRPLGLLLLTLAFGTALFWRTGAQPGPIHALVYTLNLITLQVSPDALPGSLELQLASLGLGAAGLLAIASGAANLIDYARDPQQLQMALASTLSNHVIVCGVGRVGYRVINELRDLGDAVVAINRSTDEEWLEPFQKAGVPVIIADARRRETLEAAGVKRAASLIACTSDDLTNLDIALDARELNPNLKIVMRMFDQKLAEKVSRGFGIQTAFSVSALAAPALAAAATRTRVNYSFKLEGQLINVVSLTVEPDSPWANQTVQFIEMSTNCTVIALGEGVGMAMHPAQTQIIRPGDRLHCVGPLEGIRSLQNHG
jgi:voltage-gated potassium channel